MILPTLTLTTARTRPSRWEKLSVWTARFIMWRTGMAAGGHSEFYFLLRYLGLCPGSGDGMVIFSPWIGKCSPPTPGIVSWTLGLFNRSFILNWYWWKKERRGEAINQTSYLLSNISRISSVINRRLNIWSLRSVQAGWWFVNIFQKGSFQKLSGKNICFFQSFAFFNFR